MRLSIFIKYFVISLLVLILVVAFASYAAVAVNDYHKLHTKITSENQCIANKVNLGVERKNIRTTNGTCYILPSSTNY